MLPHAYALITAGDKYDVNLYVFPVLTRYLINLPVHTALSATRLKSNQINPTPQTSPSRTIEVLTSDKTFDKVVRNIHTHPLPPSSHPSNSPQKLNRFRRAKAASANGFETLGLYAAGIVAANASGVPTATVNKLALGYIASRVVFNYIYVFLQDNRKFAPLRTLVWMAGIAIIFMLYTSAGRAIAL